MADMMRAVRLHQYGGPEVLRVETVPVPAPAAGEILVRVHAAALNPVDWKVREGYLKDMFNHPLPLVPGWDVSGVVAAVGADVTAFRPGDEVYSRPDLSRNGAYADYMVVRASEVALKPRKLGHVEAAAMPLAALTAWQAFDNAGLTAGQSVLIHAAAGGVGGFAVQLAKARGATVIATASAANHGYLRDLGADVVIDYRTEKFEDRAGPVDVLFDLMGGETQDRSWSVLKPGGTLVSIVDPVTEGRDGKRGLFTFVQPNPVQLAELARMADAGALSVTVAATFPLEAAAQAQEHVRKGHTRGKVVLEVVG